MPDPGYRLCYECDGKGECTLCGGEGWYDGARCGNCLGKKWCPICTGAGQLPDEREAPAPAGPPVAPNYTGKIPPR